MRLLLCLMFMFSTCYAALNGPSTEQQYQQEEDSRIYIDDEEIESSEDSFYIHMGYNVWLNTNTIHRDISGLYTYERSILKCSTAGIRLEYEKKWKCPYCFHYWPIGTACQNKDCPSRY